MELSRKTFPKVITSISLPPGGAPEKIRTRPLRDVHSSHHSSKAAQDLELFVTNDLDVGWLSRRKGWPTHPQLVGVHQPVALSAQVSILLQKERV